MALRAYKLCISPYFRGSCRFLPSCADYAAEAIEYHGLLRGGRLALRRLARCHPLCDAGHDPVPRPSHETQDFGPAANAGLTAFAKATVVRHSFTRRRKTCATE